MPDSIGVTRMTIRRRSGPIGVDEQGGGVVATVTELSPGWLA